MCKCENKKLRYVFFIYLPIWKIPVCVQLYGIRAHWGHYSLYFEALKGLLLKNALIIIFLLFSFSDFCRKCHAILSWNIIKLIPLGSSTSKYKKSPFSIWLYEGERWNCNFWVWYRSPKTILITIKRNCQTLQNSIYLYHHQQENFQQNHNSTQLKVCA